MTTALALRQNDAVSRPRTVTLLLKNLELVVVLDFESKGL